MLYVRRNVWCLSAYLYMQSIGAPLVPMYFGTKASGKRKDKKKYPPHPPKKEAHISKCYEETPVKWMTESHALRRETVQYTLSSGVTSLTENSRRE